MNGERNGLETQEGIVGQVQRLAASAGAGQPFVLFRPSTDWIRPPPTLWRAIYSTQNPFKCGYYPKTLSQRYPE